MSLVLLACYGLAWIVGSAKISLWAREGIAKPFPLLVELLECVGCFGFWEGFGLAFTTGHRWFENVSFGFAVAASNLILEAWTNGGD
jgi:hypothetical protein